MILMLLSLMQQLL